MRLLILILAFTINSIVSSPPGEYAPVEAINGTYSEEIQELCNFGAQYIAKEATLNGDFPSGKYTVSQIHKIEERVANGYSYKFNIELSNGKDLIVPLTYVVYYNQWTNVKEVTSYTVKSNEDEEDGYIQLSMGYIDNDKGIEDLLNYGAQYVIQEAILKRRLPDNEFTIIKVFSCQRKITNGANYKYAVGLTNLEGLYVKVHYNIYSQPWTKTQKITYYDYEITKMPKTAEYEEYVQGVLYEEEDYEEKK